MRIGVFLCHCGNNIAGVVDIDEVKKALKGQDDVVVLADSMHACAESGQEEIGSAIEEHELDRIVIAACSPRLHEQTFRRTLVRAGLNPYLLEMANIREQCSWVHSREPKRATAKAIDQVLMAVAKARLLKPLEQTHVSVRKEAMVLGGGVAGIHAALQLARTGVEVHLVERSPTLGGHMFLLNDVFPTNDCSICVLAPLMVDAQYNPRIHMHTLTTARGLEGQVGDFTVHLRTEPRYVDEEKCSANNDCIDICPISVPDEYDAGISLRKAIYVPRAQAVPSARVIDPQNCVGCGLCEQVCEHDAIDYDAGPQEFSVQVGTIIVATGYRPFDASRKREYGYGIFPDVITSLELERMLDAAGSTRGRVLRPSDGKPPQSIAFLQCVGSRDHSVGNAYCSRVCCMVTIKNSELLLKSLPGARATVYHVDIRAYDRGYEEAYERTQRKGVRFVRSRAAEVLPADNGRLSVVFEDPETGDPTREEYDMVVLAIGMEPGEGTGQAMAALGLSAGTDGFVQVAHPKMRPVDSLTPGIFLAGCATGPKDITSSISQAGAAAARAAGLVIRGEVGIDPIRAEVDAERCNGCRLCVEVCPFSAIKMKEGEKLAEVNAVACTGCGVCAAACPADAIDIAGYTDEQIKAQIRAGMAAKRDYPLIALFLCNWCSYAGADIAGMNKLQYPPNTRNIRLMCTGRFDPSFAIEALQAGADGVLVAGCRPDECHYKDGNERARQRLSLLSQALSEIGISPSRVREAWVAASEGEKLARVIEEFADELRGLGPTGTELAGREARK